MGNSNFEIVYAKWLIRLVREGGLDAHRLSEDIREALCARGHAREESVGDLPLLNLVPTEDAPRAAIGLLADSIRDVDADARGYVSDLYERVRRLENAALRRPRLGGLRSRLADLLHRAALRVAPGEV